MLLVFWRNILELQINVLSSQQKGLVMEKKYKTKEELIAAFKHAVGAKDAFESLVKGKMSKADFEKQGYKLAEID
jgi:hypothetical protein